MYFVIIRYYSYNRALLIKADKKSNQIDKSSVTCSPKLKVGFLKTHKCASSSIQNILLRFSLKHDLNVVLGAKNNYLGKFWPPRDFGNQDHFKREIISNTIWEKAHLKYDMLYCHTRWDHSAVSKVLSDKGDVFYFSILRDPVEQFRSFWDYFHIGRRLGTTLEKYVRHVMYKEIISQSKTQRSIGYNQMLTDFGVDFNDMIKKETDRNMNSVKERIRQKVKDIDNNFDLIIFAEFYEDSIILLKHSLCWQYEDLISLKLNSAKDKSQISQGAQNIMRSWLWADYILYDYFLKKFEKKKADFGHEKMIQEREKLRWTYNTETDECKSTPSDKLCVNLGKGEKLFLDELRERQTSKSLKILKTRNTKS